MSQQDFKRVKRRLGKAKQEIDWVLAVMHDREDALKSYNLDAAEKEQVALESIEVMTELLLPLAQQLAKHPQAPVESATLERMEHLHFSQYNFNEVVTSDDIVSIEVVSSGGPPRREPTTSSNEAAAPDVAAGYPGARYRGGLSFDGETNVVSEGGGTRQGDHENEDI